MDGYEACKLIHKHITEEFNLHRIKKNILIYALTGEVSQEIKLKMSSYPFTSIFNLLRVCDINQIELDIQQNKDLNNCEVKEILIEEIKKEEE